VSRIILLICFVKVLGCVQTHAQGGLGAYTDLFNKFYVADNGSTTEVEYLAPRDYKVGRTGVAYLDNLGLFKVYRNGIVNKVNTNFTSAFGVSDNFIFYKTQTALHVIDGDVDEELCKSVGDYAVGDSIAFFFDRIKNVLYAYYGGHKMELENNLAVSAFNDYKVSDNIIAYQNFANQFKVVHNGEVQILETQPIKEYAVGRNNIAYLDINGQFKIYQDGQTHQVDAFAPKRYAVGDNIVAYVGYDGYFKIFYEGKSFPIGFFEKRFTVQDNIVAFEDGAGFFKIFYKGNVYDVDNYYPNEYLCQYKSLAYINKGNVLRLFSDGKINDVTTMVNKLDNIALDYDVLRYKVGTNMFRFFVDGQESK
jgi:hypothetical protein